MFIIPNIHPLVFKIGLLALVPGFAWSQSNACDLAMPYGTIGVADVQAAINMTLGISPCTANIGGAGVCNVAIVQRVVNAALGGGCVTGTGAVEHYATLTWVPSTSGNVVGYNVYRGSASAGPYTKLTSSLVAGISYTDSTVAVAQTYYYVVTAVDSTGNESAYSTPTSAAVVPTP